MAQFVHEPAREIPVRASVDVLVVGGGPAGLMAAQAASGKGLDVMLIENRGSLGGNMTQGLPLLGFLGRKGNEVIKGLPLQFVERLRARGQATHHRACPLHVSLTMIESGRHEAPRLGNHGRMWRQGTYVRHVRGCHQGWQCR